MSKVNEIISHLRQDSRSSLVPISHQTKIPVSTLYDQIRKLSHDQVIKKFTSWVDFSKLGYSHHSKIVLMVDCKERQILLDFLKQCPAVNSISKVNHGFDYMVELVHKDVKEYSLFMEELKDKFLIINLHEYQILEEIEKEKFLTA